MKQNKIVMAIAMLAMAGSTVACSAFRKNDSKSPVVPASVQGLKHDANACPADGEYTMDEGQSELSEAMKDAFPPKFTISKIDGGVSVSVGEKSITMNGQAQNESEGEGESAKVVSKVTGTCVGGKLQIDVTDADGKPTYSSEISVVESKATMKMTQGTETAERTYTKPATEAAAPTEQPAAPTEQPTAPAEPAAPTEQPANP